MKAILKTEKEIDVRIAIGVGAKIYDADRISESNGQAFVMSGLCFEQLKKRRIGLITPWEKFNQEWKVLLQMASLIMDNWAPKTSIIFSEALKNPSLTQKELAKKK